MNKFSYKNHEIELMIEQENEFTVTDLIKLVQAIPTSPASTVATSLKESPFKLEPFKPSDVKFYPLKGEDNPLTVKYQEEVNPIKDRLPNREKIRLNDLKVEVVPYQKSQTFRCPNCHQSTLIVVDHIALVRPFNSDCELYEVNLSDKTTFAYQEAMMNYTGEGNVQLVASHEILGYCPCCQQSNETLKWIEAYEVSTDQRVKSDICPFCGDDIVESFSGTETKKICDNTDCFSYQLGESWEERV